MENIADINPVTGRGGIKVGTLIGSIAVPVIVGSLSAVLTSSSMKQYNAMPKPPMAPPAYLFPIVWTILYIMMGVAFYYVWTTEADEGLRDRAVMYYAIQLGMNFFWSILFFSLSLYLFSYFWLLGMLLITVLCTVCFFRIRIISGVMMLPYILWLSFASYLNCAAYILNKTT